MSVLEKRMEELQGTAKVGSNAVTNDFGITETKDIVLVLIDIANATKKSLADGKFSTTDLFNYVGVVTKLPKALSGIEFVPAEVGNLSDEEITELITLIANDVDYLDDEKNKEIVKKSLKVVLALKELIEEF